MSHKTKSCHIYEWLLGVFVDLGLLWMTMIDGMACFLWKAVLFYVSICQSVKKFFSNSKGKGKLWVDFTFAETQEQEEPSPKFADWTGIKLHGQWLKLGVDFIH